MIRDDGLLGVLTSGSRGWLKRPSIWMAHVHLPRAHLMIHVQLPLRARYRLGEHIG
jgi:hypothetical protein